MPLDWTKPIQFENGEPCELIETHPNGTPNYPDCTRIIRRTGVDTSTQGGLMSSIWWMKEDGKSNAPGFNVINVPEVPHLHAIVFQEGEWWVGQCIEKDIAVQAKTFEGVKEEFKRTLEAYKEIGKEKGLVSPLEILP